MSIFKPHEAPCPDCGESVPFAVCFSVNADRRPDLRDAVLDATLQSGTCARCGARFRAPPDLTYLDVGRREWILVKRGADYANWIELETTCLSVFDRAYGPRAGGAARALGASLRARVAFGWPAFREKVLCGDHGLDDVVVEQVKLTLVRSSVDGTRLSDDAELRLDVVSDDTLEFVWVNPTNERVSGRTAVPRALYATIAGDGEAWAEAREALTAGPFVDMNRLLVPSEAPAP